MKLIIGVCAAILIVLAGGSYFEMRQIEASARVAAAEKARQEQEARDALNQRFEDKLNAFLQSVAEKAKAYKARRRIFTDLIKPANMADPRYVEENYGLMQAAAPDLRKQMDDIMASFQAAEADIYALIRDEPEDRRKAVIASWQTLKDKRATAYMAFFAAEQDIVKAYLDLMAFYRERRGAFAYEAASSTLVFRDEADKARQLELLKAIGEMEAQEARVLDKGD